MDLTHEYTHDIGPRFKYLSWIITAVLLLILGRLYYLQVIKGPYYYFFSEQNSIKEMKIYALRGTIFDRDGKILVENRAAFDVVVVPQYVMDRGKILKSLSNILKMDEEKIDERIKKAANMPSYYPVTIASDVGDDVISVIRAYKTPWYDEDDLFDLRGVDVQMRYARFYPDGLAASHLLGYIKEIDAERLKAFSGSSRYKMGDFIGVGGIEEMWDDLLRGSDGFDQKVVNAMGREIIWPGMELIHEEPQNGASLKLSIDADLQAVAKEELKDKSGAVVALDSKTGEVLALYSSPSIDLNELASSTGGDYWQKISSDQGRPIFNRAIQAAYPPGSTFKIVTATAALGEKEITPQDKLYCGGGIHFGNRFYKCWRDGGHGSVALREALAASCDAFFYQLGLRLGVDKVAKYANLLGLGVKTGIDLPGEKEGLFPTSGWKEAARGQKWQAGENLSMAVGQGFDLVTPLQNAVMVATIANGGKKITPHVALSIMDEKGAELYRWRDENHAQVLDPKEVEVIKGGLQDVVDSLQGTGYRLKSLGLKIAGKTGTAQVVSREKWKSGLTELKDHAWFVGYAPYDDPQIAVAVIVEHGGFGASAAAPVVGKIIEKYLKR